MATLRVCWGQNETLERPLAPGVTSVGRGPENAVEIPEPLLSKRHLTIELEDDVVVVSDCGSKNGTTLGALKLLPNLSYPVNEGDELVLGQSVTVRIQGITSADATLIDRAPKLDISRRLQRLQREDQPLFEWLEAEHDEDRDRRRALAQAVEMAGQLGSQVNRRARLSFLVGLVSQLTKAPTVWALEWQRNADGRLVFRDLVHEGEPLDLPDTSDPGEGVSQGVVEQVLSRGRPLWSRDASQDQRLACTHSVMSLRAIGCIPLGDEGVLYISDPQAGELWPRAAQIQIEALCTVVSGLVLRASQPDEAHAGDTVMRGQLLPGLVGDSLAMRDLAEKVHAFARFPRWNILILGQMGTGKTQLAEAIHHLHNNGGNFVHVTGPTLGRGEHFRTQMFGWVEGGYTGAAGTSAGFVGAAQDGTLFLDEIGDLDPESEGMLLQLTRERKYVQMGAPTSPLHFNGRIIAATNRPIDSPDASFRRDLWGRLAHALIRMPALHERAEDIPLLVEHFVYRFCTENETELEGRRFTVSASSMRYLAGGRYEQNVAGLQTLVQRGCIMANAEGSDVVELRHLEERAPMSAGPRESSYKQALHQFERDLLLAAYEDAGRVKLKAAKRLGMSRQAFHRVCQRVGLTLG